MHDPYTVYARERLCETRRQYQDGLDGQWTVIMHGVGERWSRNVSSGHPWQLCLRIGVDDSSGVQTADVFCCGNLAGEPGPKTAFVSQLGPDHLNCDEPTAL